MPGKTMRSVPAEDLLFSSELVSLNLQVSSLLRAVMAFLASLAKDPSSRSILAPHSSGSVPEQMMKCFSYFSTVPSSWVLNGEPTAEEDAAGVHPPCDSVNPHSQVASSEEGAAAEGVELRPRTSAMLRPALRLAR